MTSTQADELIECIQNDATIEGDYIRIDPDTGVVGYCVIGGLAKKLGYSDEQLTLYENLDDGSISEPEFEELRQQITERFGLTDAQISELQQINDRTTRVTEERRINLIAYVKSLLIPVPA